MTASRRVIALALLGIVPMVGRAEPQLDDEKAEWEFRQGKALKHDEVRAREHFHAAAFLYSFGSLGATPERLRMEGNCWLLAGDVPRAILIYRKGLIRDSDDEDCRRGLNLARSRVAFAYPDDQLALTPPPDGLAWLKRPLRRRGLLAIALANVAAWFALSRWIVTRRPRWMTMFAIALTFAGIVSAAWGLEREERLAANETPFAVVSQPVVLRRGDGLSYLPRRDAPLPVGVEVRVLNHRGNWLQVELADGTVGWLARDGLWLSSDARL